MADDGPAPVGRASAPVIRQPCSRPQGVHRSADPGAGPGNDDADSGSPPLTASPRPAGPVREPGWDGTSAVTGGADAGEAVLDEAGEAGAAPEAPAGLAAETPTASTLELKTRVTAQKTARMRALACRDSCRPMSDTLFFMFIRTRAKRSRPSSAARDLRGRAPVEHARWRKVWANNVAQVRSSPLVIFR